MLLVLLAAATVLAQAPAAQAQPPAAAPASKEVEGVTVKAPEKDPLVCKTRQPLGSKVPKRTCSKKSELEQARHDSRENMEYLRRNRDPFYRPIEP
ncbi:hypothetical protein [Phenylobacterium sp.]|jgi:hypothetical protein|uniref:hypothetical protein n=1 Tax=Phenylobacterium sp. TaxID=1871053 RepID=UPI002F94385D